MSETTITVRAHGSYRVEGPVRLVDEAGHEFDHKDVFFLCRCGGSMKKPFCDSSHKTIGFDACETALELNARLASD
jgi:CDGSH-type Zn-finger protein